jgi:hypothetical protein
MKLLSVGLAALVIATTQLSSTVAQFTFTKTGLEDFKTIVFLVKSIFGDTIVGIDFSSLVFAADAEGPFSTSLPTISDPFRVTGGTIELGTPPGFSSPVMIFRPSLGFLGAASFVFQFTANGNPQAPINVIITVIRRSTFEGVQNTIHFDPDFVDTTSLTFAADGTGTFSTSLPTSDNPFPVTGGTIEAISRFSQARPIIYFTPSPGFLGDASLVYRFNDANGNPSALFTIIITVKRNLEGMCLLCYHSNMLHGPLIANNPAHSKPHNARFSLF